LRYRPSYHVHVHFFSTLDYLLFYFHDASHNFNHFHHDASHNFNHLNNSSHLIRSPHRPSLLQLEPILVVNQKLLSPARRSFLPTSPTERERMS
jgi:hypothetical protein